MPTGADRCPQSYAQTETGLVASSPSTMKGSQRITREPFGATHGEHHHPVQRQGAGAGPKRRVGRPQEAAHRPQQVEPNSVRDRVRPYRSPQILDRRSIGGLRPPPDPEAPSTRRAAADVGAMTVKKLE